MICKIIPIKQSRGIQDCWEYITDENKVISIEKKDGRLRRTTIDTSLLNITAEEYQMGKMDFETVLNYMENEEKTHRVGVSQEKFISGYLCTPENAVQEFMDTRTLNIHKQKKSVQEETGNYAYHIIQSFPDDLDISDEEVHQCGRELCEKLRVHQAVICSHVHPVIDEEGEVSGRCKHNHILINSHIHHDMLDPEKPNVYKYHNCKESYEQLRKWNDEIAIQHGLPIIREPETGKRYSWIKSREENRGASWTALVARDIKNTMRFSADWEEFKAQMIAQGYHIRETDKNITYYTPNHTEDHKQQIREKRLGREYTKVALEEYWATVNQAKGEINVSQNRESKVPLLRALIDQYKDNLFAEIRCNGARGIYYLDIQLKNPYRDLSEKTLYTYFEAGKTYKLSTADHIPIAEISGQDISDYYEELKRQKEQRNKSEQTAPDRQRYYYDNTKRNSQTGRPYRVSLWDGTGRRRTNIELLCILARVVIKNEHGATPLSRDTATAPIKFTGEDGKAIYASTDWKLQNLYETMVLAREMKLENSSEIEQKQDKVGKEIARIRKKIKPWTEQYNQMKTINDNIQKLNEVRDLCETLYNMPDGDEKTALLQTHATELDQYKTAKRYLHLKNINTEAQITDFQTRFIAKTEDLIKATEELKIFNEEYRKLKKIEHSLTMAQNNYYCYGPDHEYLSRQPKDQPEEEQNLHLE